MSSMWVCCAVIWRTPSAKPCYASQGEICRLCFRRKAPQSTPSKHSAGVKESKAWQKGLDEEFSGL